MMAARRGSMTGETTMALMRIECPQADAAVIAETADAALLSRPLRSLADIEEIERVPLDERLRIDNFSHRVALAIEARDPEDTAIHYVPDGDIDRVAERVSFGELKRNIGRTASLLRSHGIGRSDVVAVLMPAVPAIYWSILGAMAAAIVFPVNWMLEPKYILRLLKEANVKAVIALGPTPGFQIWESLAQIAADLPSGAKIWSVAGPGGTLLPDSDLEAALDGQSGESDLVGFCHWRRHRRFRPFRRNAPACRRSSSCRTGTCRIGIGRCNSRNNWCSAKSSCTTRRCSMSAV